MNKKELANILSKKINLIIKKKINDLHSPEINDVDVNSVKKCLKSSYVSTYGPFTKKFEKEIKKITKAKYVVALNSGTSALQLSLVGLKIPKNSEILMPSLTFVATANAVIYNQCIPHFVDTEKKSFGIDFDNLEKYIKFNFIKKKNKLYNKKTGRYVTAIIPVHLFGHAVDCKKLIKFSRKHNLKIIEDAAEALGSR
jgi:perosamine synthetase